MFDTTNITDQIIADKVNLYFPFPTANPGQKEAIFYAVKHFLNRVPHVIIEAPTGIGKSVIATTVIKVLKSLDRDFRSTIMTATKNLQQQYQRTPKVDIVDLMGKDNYPCPIGCGPYNSAKCRQTVAKHKCTPKHECPYVVRRLKWCHVADIRSTNNSFMIEACTEIVCTPETRTNLTVSDECHKLPDHLIEHTTVKIDERDLYAVSNMFSDLKILDLTRAYFESLSGHEVGSVVKVEGQFREALIDLSTAISTAHARLKIALEKHKANKTEPSMAVLEVISELQGIEDKAKIFTDTESSCVILHERDAMNLGVTIKPVFASDVAEFGLFRKGDYHLHMSATICGVKEYAAALGIPPGQYEAIVIPNPIPVEQRRIHVVPIVKMSGPADDAKLRALVNAIDGVIDSHKGENGIIHTVSYKLAESIKNLSRHKGKMLVSGKQKEIMEALQSGKDRIILSPSIEEGVDLKGDLSRFQILAKVPYGFLGDALVKLRAERYPTSYNRSAVLRIVQACGRSVRGVDDYAETYILDSSFEGLLKRASDLFPSWFLDGLVFHEVA